MVDRLDAGKRATTDEEGGLRVNQNRTGLRHDPAKTNTFIHALAKPKLPADVNPADFRDVRDTVHSEDSEDEEVVLRNSPPRKTKRGAKKNGGKVKAKSGKTRRKANASKHK